MMEMGSHSVTTSPRIRHLSRRPQSAAVATNEKQALTLSRFTRSLKLLGMDPKEFGIDGKSRDESSCRKVGGSQTHRSIGTGTFSTRLSGRSVSLNDLSTTVAQTLTGSQGMLDCASREKLSQAVYEEWYFRKLEAAKKRKVEEERERRRKEMEELQAKEELKVKCEQSFSEWKKQKNSTHRKQLKPVDDKKVEDTKKYTKEEIDAGLRAWMGMKDAVLKNRSKQKAKELKKKQNEKKEKTDEAQTAFQYWKKEADKVLENKKKEERVKRLKEEEAKRRKEQEKKDIAKRAFGAWVNKKKNDVQWKKFQENREKQDLIVQEMESKEAQLNAAQQAFEEWLVNVDYRQEISAENLNYEKPPWYPVGRKSSYVN